MEIKSPFIQSREAESACKIRGNGLVQLINNGEKIKLWKNKQ